jgi:hypothetical protein
MIYMEPGNRRADTMTIVGERLAVRHHTGKFKLVAKACGYLDLVLKNLADFFEAGVIEERGTEDTEGWRELRWTKTGHYLWQQWKQGPPRAIVELPGVEQDGGTIPQASERMLTDAGWSILNAWKVTDGWVVELTRFRQGEEHEAREEKVLLLDARGLAYRGLPRAEASALAAAVIAAAR